MTSFVLAHLSDPHLGPMPRPRLRELAGAHAIDTRLPTGADEEAPAPRGEYELGMEAVEDKLRDLAERIGRKTASGD